MKHEKEWFDAYLRSDADTMNRIEAADYILILGRKGEFFTKERQIPSVGTRDEATRKRYAVLTRTLEQAKVSTYGIVAIVNGISATTQSDDKGVTQVNRMSYTGVWMKRDGGGHIVNAQYTQLLEPKPQGGN